MNVVDVWIWSRGLEVWLAPRGCFIAASPCSGEELKMVQRSRLSPICGPAMPCNACLAFFATQSYSQC